MRRELQPCASCRRHVRVSEHTCPFCGSTQEQAAVRSDPAVRLSRAAETFWLAIGASAAIGCSAVEQPARPLAAQSTAEAVQPDAAVDAEPVADAGEPVVDSGSRIPIYGSNQIVILLDIYFSSRSAQIRDADAVKLDELARVFKERSGIEVAVEGHADPSEGKGKTVELLSQRRAESVQRALIKAGVSEAQLTIEAHGTTNLQVPASTIDEERQRNRRVRFRVTKQPPGG